MSVSEIPSRIVGGAFRSRFFLRAARLIYMVHLGVGEAEEGGRLDEVG